MLTEEQTQAVELANGSYSDLKIEAFAGAGKTTTLKAIGEQRGDSGLYVAFNKAIADEAKRKFPSNVACRTGHSLAFGEVGLHYSKRLRSVNGGDVRAALDVQRNDFHTASGIAYLALDTLRRFCYSADGKITGGHVDFDIASKEPETTHYVVKLAREIWDLMEDREGDFPVTHDFYLKRWQLNSPELGYDFILFDEAQDANAVILDIVTNQPCQKIYVGDKYQQIYGWRGAQNAMRDLPTENHCHITQSFRFGQKIADVANSIIGHYLGDEVNIKGFEKMESELDVISSPDAVLFRTNAKMIDHVLSEVEKNNRVYVIGGVGAMIGLLQGAEQLREGKRSYNAELLGFQNFEELEEYSKTSSGQQMALICKLVNEGVSSDVIKALEKNKYTKREHADVIFSTCHKSKGLEFPEVKIADDFRSCKEKHEPFDLTDEDARLFYVACTRAENILDVESTNAHKAMK
jgi:hypothetical protein